METFEVNTRQKQIDQGLFKLNLGCGFKKKDGYLNVDVGDFCQPDIEIDLAKEEWPWEDGAVGEVTFDFSLEEMGETKSDLMHIIRQLYRVCAPNSKVFIRALHPSHDEFATNPLAIHKLSPSFFQLLDVAHNLNQIANGQHYTCLGLILNVNFKVTHFKHLLTSDFGQMFQNKEVTEKDLHVKMRFERNVIHAFEVEMVRI